MHLVIKDAVISFVKSISGFRSRSSTMAPEEFKVTDTFEYRYQNNALLRQALISLGYKDEDIKIKASENGAIQVNLPETLTKEQRSKIQVYMATKQKEEGAQDKDKEGEDE
ncbi:hypothetical protein F5Y18DRAFT_429094 [Xylariaceae sp. FL1019]|nr:hypothetical protein F5Y18DRAFT_429094 [Xylariaceae sp. FL1019]